MIRINLLPQKKTQKADRGQQALLVGMLSVFLVGLGVYMLFHRPLAEEVDDARAHNRKLQKSIKDLEAATKDYEIIKKELEAAKKQDEAIQQLNAARAVPAWMLHELSMILTKDRSPNMTPEMQLKVHEDEDNRQWTSWDPKRVWIDSFEEKGGTFIMRGGAQSESDITQLALRMQASAYFPEVVPEGGQREIDKTSKIGIYRFTITGKVAY